MSVCVLYNVCVYLMCTVCVHTLFDYVIITMYVLYKYCVCVP